MVADLNKTFSLSSLRRDLDNVMIADYSKLHSQWRNLSRDMKLDPSRSRDRLLFLQNKIEKSLNRVMRRTASLPPLSFPEELPISEHKDRIIESIRRNPVTIISGETGSGKTTQIPKMCLAAGFGRRGAVALTQPRRIAAVSIAQRIAFEIGEVCGGRIAYKIRFEEKGSPDSLVQVMTDGILLTEISRDRNLLNYDTIIIDEAHERSLNIDFLLGYLRTLILRRKDLKVLITSATIDTAKFSQAFNDAPVIEISGRIYPVEVRYQPVASTDDEQDEPSYVQEAVACVERLQRERRFEDILIFLPRESDIREACGLLEKKCSGLILPLYARLSNIEQRKVFSAQDCQKIIVATNIAETSLTIPDIKYVIDSGLARLLEYNSRTQTTSLPVKPISQSSADQRKGRCGRVRDGICIRLYSEEDFNTRVRFTRPEILRANLAGVILRMLSFPLGPVASFPFVDPPNPRSLRDGLDSLKELGALSRDDASDSPDTFRLSPVGIEMARLPVDPRVSRMLLAARSEDCVAAVAVIASFLSIADPRERPFDKLDQASAAHAIFQHPESDFLGMVNLWNRFQHLLGQNPSQSSIRKFCRESFLSRRRMFEWRDTFSQILGILIEDPPGGGPNKIKKAIPLNQDMSDRIHRCILAGYLSNIAVKKEKNIYTAAKNRDVMLHPGSALFNHGPGWIVAAEIAQTSRVFARHAAGISIDWLEELGKDLCKRSYSSPHWEKNRGQVVALEKVTLFGLTIIEGRAVGYDKIAPEEARHIFIREALVRGEVTRRPAFLDHNFRLWEEAKKMEDKLRTRGVAADDDTLARLYDARLPNVADMRSLLKCIKDRGGDAFLRFSPDELFLNRPDEEILLQYPDKIAVSRAVFPCRYRFSPGRPDDGITVKIPVGLLSAKTGLAIERNLASMMEEKISALVKMLPKSIRQKLPPGRKIAQGFLATTSDQETSLPLSLSRYLLETFSVPVAVELWKIEALPQHLSILYQAVDENGTAIKESRDLQELEHQLSGQLQSKALDKLRQQWERSSITKWDFGSLPDKIPVTGATGLIGHAYPGLSDDDGSVRLTLFGDSQEAAQHHPSGVSRLYCFYFSDQMRQLKKNVSLSGWRKDAALKLGPPKKIQEALMNRVITELFERLWRTREAFEDHARKIAADILPTGQIFMDAADPVLVQYSRTYDAIHKLLTANRLIGPVAKFLDNMLSETRLLVPVDFSLQYSLDRQKEIPRYLKALELRAERGCLNYAAQNKKSDEIALYSNQYNALNNSCSRHTSAERKAKIDEFRWLIEEYKVSLFAQELKTSRRVSPKILQQMIDEILKMI